MTYISRSLQHPRGAMVNLGSLLYFAMRRRSLLRYIFNSTAMLSASRLIDSGLIAALEQKPKSTSRPQIALTMDDPNVDVGPNISWQEANNRILDALNHARLRAALFVCGMRVDSAEGKNLLTAWDEAGHLLCNHSYAHKMYLKRTGYDDYAEDYLKNEPIISGYKHFTRFFRYPFLKEGDTAEKRDRFRALLKAHGYEVGHVTVDASDWYVNDRMQKRLANEPKAKLEPYRDYLIAHLQERADFYRKLSVDVLGHEIRHTLLVHFNALNALFLPEILHAFVQAGWEWIGADRAYEDPIFKREPKIAPAGESLVWALATESGKFKERLRWPGEDGDYEQAKMDALGL